MKETKKSTGNTRGKTRQNSTGKKSSSRNNVSRKNPGRKNHKLFYALIVAAILLIKLVTGTLDAQDLEALTSLSGIGQTGQETTISPTTAETIAETIAGNTPETIPSDFLSPEDIPAYSGQPYIVLNNNIPYFTEEDITTASFEQYGDLDELGRCTAAYANVGTDLMPTEKRGNISSIKPSGWHSVQYEHVDGKSLYNRCHLIGFQLTGENANKKNLITGTRYLNVEGMLPFENMIADYVKETNNHVLYRVTPIFRNDDLVADGVQMEAWSVEDKGEGICFHVFAYNVQPGVEIDYATGDSWLADEP